MKYLYHLPRPYRVTFKRNLHSYSHDNMKYHSSILEMEEVGISKILD
jgi:hypothetical protein